LSSNTKDHGGKTHYTDSQNSDTTAPSGRELYHLQFSRQAASPETFGYTLICKVLSQHFSRSTEENYNKKLAYPATSRCSNTKQECKPLHRDIRYEIWQGTEENERNHETLRMNGFSVDKQTQHLPNI
jgi:hypothetical protein